MHSPRFRPLFVAIALALCVLSLETASRPAFAQAPLAPAPLEKKWQVRGLLRDAQGQPVPNAEIVLQPGSLVFGKIPAPITLKSDTAGRFLSEIEAPQVPKDALETAPKSEAELREKWRVYAMIHAPGFALCRVDLRAGDNDITLERGAQISGTVRDAAGQPVAAARVRVQNLSTASNGGADVLSLFNSFISLDESVIGASFLKSFETLTDAAGNWTLRDLPPLSNAYVILDDPRFLRQSTEAPLGATPDEPAPAVPDLIAKPGARVVGRVLFPDGKPVADAAVTAQGESGYAQGRTSADGTFSLSGLPAGKTTIQVTPPSEAWAPTGIVGLPIATSKETRAPDFTMGKGILLTGTVLDANSKKPLAGARVIATGPLGSASSTLSDEQGHYSVRAVAGQNRFYITLPPPDYLRDWNGQISQSIAANGVTAPGFSLRRGISLTGTALDEAGQPAKGATISSGSGFEGARTSVDEKGAWTLRGVDGHELRTGNAGEAKGEVVLKTDGDWQIVGDSKVRAGAAPIALTLRRIERQNVMLRVTTPDGAPVAGAKVRIAILFDPTNGSRRMENAMTNARGEITLRALRPDESAEITPSKTGYTLLKSGIVARLDAKTGAPRVVDAVLTSLDGWVQGRVVDEGGAAVAGALVGPLFPGDLRDVSEMAKTDANGNFRIEGLRAGALVVGAAKGREWGQSSGKIGQTLEIKLQSAASQPDGRDIERAFVLMAQWLDEGGPKPGYELTNLAEQLAFVDRDRAQKLLARFGDKNRRNLSSDTVLALVRRDPAKTRRGAHCSVSSGLAATFSSE